jgi:hypothetical protein
MTCRYLEKYDQGEMDEAEFKRHAASCSTCREALRLDEDVMSMAETLRHHIDAPPLWSRIEDTLRKELAEKRGLSTKRQAEKSRKHKRLSLPWRRLLLVPAGVVLLVAVGLIIYFGLHSHTPSSGLLARKALARVEQKEQEYLSAIQDLEKQAIPQMASLDLELIFLYRDRLETIDAQIEQCREALASNQANAHIRRYLIAALQDKKETLVEVLSLKNEKTKLRRST